MLQLNQIPPIRRVHIVKIQLLKLIFMRTLIWHTLSQSGSVTLAREKRVVIRGQLSMLL